MVREIWLSKNNNNDNNNREEESSSIPACRISVTVSSLVLKLSLQFVVGSSRLDNHSHTQFFLLYQVGERKGLVPVHAN